MKLWDWTLKGLIEVGIGVETEVGGEARPELNGFG
jgi:hypothetical protein